MAPIRRFIRVKRRTMLECRIYVDVPSLLDSWLLNPRNPALPRVIEKSRETILHQLQEEGERSKEKSKKSAKPIRDVVEGDDFECAVWLQSGSTGSYNILTAEKTFSQPTQSTTSGTGAAGDDPIDVDQIEGGPRIMQEDDDEPALNDIPAASEGDTISSAHPSAGNEGTLDTADASDDKKKLRMATFYEGYSVHSSILYLLVKRK